MTIKPDKQARLPNKTQIEFVKIDGKDTGRYLDLYKSIGSDYGWSGRLLLDKAELIKILQSTKYKTYIAKIKNGQDVGLCEYELHKNSVELVYFGLISAKQGQGYGKFLMQWTIEKARQFGKTRLILHTCRFDHPRALEVYQKAGFKIMKQQIDYEHYPENFIAKQRFNTKNIQTMTVNEKLQALRKLMQENEIDAYIVSGTDPHIGEYVPEYWQTRSFLSGFTGSAGVIVVTQSFAGLWTDSRYFIQAEKELADSDFELVKLVVPHTPEYIGWIQKNMQAQQTVATDAALISASAAAMLQKEMAKFRIKIAFADLLSPIWTNRPKFPTKPVQVLDQKFAGESVNARIKRIRAIMSKNKADYYLITALDDIAWTLNIRGEDIEYNPLIVSYLMIQNDGIQLFVKNEKLNETAHAHFSKSGIDVHDYDAVFDYLEKLPFGSKIMIDYDKTNQKLLNSLHRDAFIIKYENLVSQLKTIKNKTEIAHLRKVMIKDGIALTKFLYWLEQNIGKKEITEWTAAEKLHTLRAQQKDFRGDSFCAISGYKGNGAIIHYSVAKETAAKLQPEGIYLIDSGGQYLQGTTDTTRTVSLGAATDQQKMDYTLVLKGHIQLAMAKFPAGTHGYQLDILARSTMWQHGRNYGHGTGHGVGFYLNVHEGPQSIRPNATATSMGFRAGMLTSNEPGIYIANEYGIRIENLILSQIDQENEFGQFLKFETISLCHIDQNLIVKEMLTPEETTWLNNYHNDVYEKISPNLDTELKNWLQEKTKAL